MADAHSEAKSKGEKTKALHLAPVVSLCQRRAADTIETLDLLLKQANNGELHGLIFAAKYRTRTDIGITGEYVNRAGADAAMVLERELDEVATSSQ